MLTGRGSERESYEAVTARTKPLNVMFEFLKHKGVQGGNVPEYMDPLTIAETILAAQEGGYADSPVMRQYREALGVPAGIPATGPIQVRHPITGDLITVENQNTIMELQAAAQELQVSRITPWKRTRELLGAIKQQSKGQVPYASMFAYEDDIKDVPKEILSEGTRAHFELTNYLKAAQASGAIPGIKQVEKSLSEPGGMVS